MRISQGTRKLNQCPLILPEILEPSGRKLRIADRVLNVFVAKVELYRAGVLAGIRQVETSSVAQHVRMNRKPNIGRLGGFGDDVMERAPRHWAAR